MTTLIAVSYVSRAVKALDMEEVEHLLLRARARNLEHGVTGVLLHRNNRFMQYIEGPPEGMAHVYAIIRADPLHTEVRELMNEPLAQRECGTWSMAYVATGLLAYVGNSADMKMLGADLHANTPGLSRAQAQLNAFWNGRPLD